MVLSVREMTEGEYYRIFQVENESDFFCGQIRFPIINEFNRRKN